MSYLHAISEWKRKRYEKVKSNMESIGKCPDCRGRGFTSAFTSVYLTTYDSIFDCPGCNGSGRFTDWALTNEQLH